MRNSLILSDVRSPSEVIPSSWECRGLLRTHYSSENTPPAILGMRADSQNVPTLPYCLDNTILCIDNTFVQKISLTIRVDAKDLGSWQEVSRRSGLNLSEWIRRVCNA